MALLLTVVLAPWWFTAATDASGMNTWLVLDSLWPVLAATAVAWIVLRLNLFRTLQSVPAGDILALLPHTFKLLRLSRGTGNIPARFNSDWNALQTGMLAGLTGLARIIKKQLQHTEDYLSRWDVVLLCAIIIAMVTAGVSIGFIGINSH
jgi:hypothetical protein